MFGCIGKVIDIPTTQPLVDVDVATTQPLIDIDVTFDNVTSLPVSEDYILFGWIVLGCVGVGLLLIKKFFKKKVNNGKD